MNEIEIEEQNRYNAYKRFYDDVHYMPISLRFDQVAITQQKNICKSRLDVDISSQVIRGVVLETPLIAANMSTVCNGKFCRLLDLSGALGVMHRAGDIQDIVDQVEDIADSAHHVAASVGIGEEQLYFARRLVDAGANIIFVDVAHGYNDEVIDFGRRLKKEFGVKVVLGNTTNLDMLYEVADFVDALKVGIAQGFACETKNTAGCTEGQFTAVLKFKAEAKRLGVPIISDGSIKEPADFTKAIAAGASSAMCGKIFAACPESAAEIQEIDGQKKKVYAGMASRYVQNRWKGELKEGTCPEGGIRYLDMGEPVDKLLERYGGALRSGITYSGADHIKGFQDKVRFVRIG